MRMVHLHNLFVRMEGQTILRNIALAADRGQFIGLIGPNGSGKSTLLRTIAGLIRHAEGKLEIGRKPIESYKRKALARIIGYVPQDTTIDFAFRVRDIVTMGRTPYLARFQQESAEDKLIVERAMKRAGVAHLAERFVSSLSGGQRQLVFIAKALAQTPQLLLLDEPISALDIRHQLQTLDLIRQLAYDGKCAIAALHDINLAARYCDQLVLLNHGSVVSIGTPDQVLTQLTIRSTYNVHAELQQDPWLGCLSVTPITANQNSSTAFSQQNNNKPLEEQSL
ncbi:ABC transporter ATP-binding protein [Paenibacillaceae bacterium]|nr:ABC transporter ATP-binding protein [Paenibacillaceae bacterium]